MGLRKVSTLGAAIAPGGTEYLWITLPVGVRLRLAAAQNSSVGSNRVTMFLCDPSLIDKSGPVIRATPPFDFIPLNDDSVQGGLHDWVMFQGDEEISPGLNTLVALLYNTVGGNELKLVAGYVP